MRRADSSMQFPVILAIVAISILVAIVLAIGLMRLFDGVDTDLSCAAQVQAHSLARWASGGIANPDITCPTNILRLETDDEELIKRAIAEEMKQCWDNWGRGELQLFGNQEGVYCHVCTMVDVNGPSTILGFPQYLDGQMATDELTYAEYLSGETSGGYFEGDEFQRVSSFALTSDSQIAIIFTYAKGLTFMERQWNAFVGNPSVGIGTGVLTGGGVGARVGLFFGPVGAVVGGLGGSVAGGAGGLLLSHAAREDTSYMASIHVRQLTADDVESLGCQYFPAG